MPFMRGVEPIRRTIKYLTNSPLTLKPYVEIFALHYNRLQANHDGAVQFSFWHLPQLQYKNPKVQVCTVRQLTPTPFIRVWLSSGRELLLDIDRQSKDEIHERVVTALCKTKEELLEEQKAKEIQDNPANFGFGCPKHCACEIPGQVPCPFVVPVPYAWRGKYKFGHAELDESKYI
jgi:small subunit ribosomal protein S25